MLQAVRITRDHYREIARQRVAIDSTDDFAMRYFPTATEPLMVVEDQPAAVIAVIQKYYPHKAELCAVIERTLAGDGDASTVWFLVMLDREDLGKLTIAQLRVAVERAMAYTPSQVREAIAGRAA